jgi:polyisoprenoid-binding protein YceI
MTNPTDAETPTLTHFVIDAGASRFTVQAFAAGLLSVAGHNPTIGIQDFRGEVDFSPDTLESRAFRLTILASSLKVLNDISDKDQREMERLMNEQVLESTKYPGIIYDAPSVKVTSLGGALYSAVMNGTLNLHGVTRTLPITARIALFGDMLRASGDFILLQSDYQIKPVSVAGGALKLKDELKFSFEFVARKA